MKKKAIPLRFLTLASALIFSLITATVNAEHKFSGFYTNDHLSKIAFPIGGTGAGNFFLEGTGAITGVSVKHRLDYFNEPTFFTAICIKGNSPEKNLAKIIEGPVPSYKIFNRPGNALGSGEKTYGLPRFTQASFKSDFPFCTINLSDNVLPLSVEIVGFSPFIPNEPDLSCMPVGAIEYNLRNTSSDALDAVFSVNMRNFMGGETFERLPNGVNVVGTDGKFAVAVQEEPHNVHVDGCWFRGGWFDPLTVAWNNILTSQLIDNPSDGNASPGASITVPIHIEPLETRTIRVLTAWYVPTSNISSKGSEANSKILLDEHPAKGTAQNQQMVSGYVGHQLVNTYYPNGDAHEGILLSPTYSTLKKKYLYFKIGGGSLSTVGVSIQEQNDQNEAITLKTFRGTDEERLVWKRFDLSTLSSDRFNICIFDKDSGPWGHVNADCFVLSNLDEVDFFQHVGNLENQGLSTDQYLTVLCDFESADFGNWTIIQPEHPTPHQDISDTYVPWYAKRFNSVEDVLKKFTEQYDELKTRSKKFAQTLKTTTLPPEILEAVEANLAILKTPTILRQYDGRLWAWEGCQDADGSCPGTCTHVWNYGQSIPHLFPKLERTFRQNEFNESLTQEGRQAFRGNLPIVPGGTAWDASDGQLGSIMRLHREWKIAGTREFLQEYWPKAKLSLDYCIKKWDPNETGLLEQSHHNTYDINYIGPEGHCSSFYLGALAAACRMGAAYGDDVTRYQELLSKGRQRYETELFNGEYFIQKAPIPGQEGRPEEQSVYYKEIARKVDQEGPKYQYGTGCLSDGVLGFWMAKICGIDEDLINPQLIHSHLLSVYKYNFKKDLSSHANPQRPTYALGQEGGLLLCSWPHNDKPLIPFPYSDEVWTGIEYQVASHLAFFGEYDKASEIVKTCRMRYDGSKRNPFDEYECGHFYARATSSFGLLQGMTGVRYDAVSKTLFYRELNNNYTVPVFTETGYGILRYDVASRKATIEVVEGSVDVQTFQIAQ